MTPPLEIADVIITGGTGFIGSALVRRLTSDPMHGRRVHAPGSREVDLVDRAATLAWFERLHWGSEASHIFHLAALYKAGGWPATHPATQFYVNMAMNVNVLEAWKRFFPRARFTSVLSYCVYPDHDRPHPESEIYGTEPEHYLYAYAFTKKALVMGQRAYCQEFGLSAASAVLPTVYGPGDSFAENSHVMGALIGKFGRAARDGSPSVDVWGDGLQEREFLYVEDVVTGLLRVATGETSPVINLGTGEGVSVKRLAELVARETGYTGRIRYATDRFVGARRRVMSVELASRELGWRASTSLEQGVRETVTAFRAASTRDRAPEGKRAP